MNDKFKIDAPWFVTVVFVPIIGLSGLRMLTTIDDIGQDVQLMKVQQAVTSEQVQQIRAYMRIDQKP